MNRGAHLGGARKGSRADQSRIKNGHRDRKVGVEPVVVIREGERSAGLQCSRHLVKDPRQPFREVLQCPSHAKIPSKFIGMAGCDGRKLRVVGLDEFAQPDVAEVHQLRILDVPKVRRVGQNSVELLPIEIHFRGIGAVQRHLLYL